MVKLTKPLLEAMASALAAALAGEFDGGDFEGEDPHHFERAAQWIAEELERRAARSNRMTAAEAAVVPSTRRSS
ncbi:MAG: hypothetical protein M9924_21180 [Rhizobiaceae bacterium]|nr:hypothetical protein [Rhizobiaceae bacterium]